MAVYPEDCFDLKGIWKEAQDEFRKTKAGKRLGKKVDDIHILSVEEVIQGIDDQAKADDEKHKLSRTIFRNTMITVQNLGGLAASGASQVSQCPRHFSRQVSWRVLGFRAKQSLLQRTLLPDNSRPELP